MADNRAVVFTKYGVHIYHGIDIAQWTNVRGCLINPKVPKGVPPHFWKLAGSKIVEMTQAEKDAVQILKAPAGYFDTIVNPSAKHSVFMAPTATVHIVPSAISYKQWAIKIMVGIALMAIGWVISHYMPTTHGLK